MNRTYLLATTVFVFTAMLAPLGAAVDDYENTCSNQDNDNYDIDVYGGGTHQTCEAHQEVCNANSGSGALGAGVGVGPGSNGDGDAGSSAGAMCD